MTRERPRTAYRAVAGFSVKCPWQESSPWGSVFRLTSLLARGSGWHATRGAAVRPRSCGCPVVIQAALVASRSIRAVTFDRARRRGRPPARPAQWGSDVTGTDSYRSRPRTSARRPTPGQVRVRFVTRPISGAMTRKAECYRGPCETALAQSPSLNLRFRRPLRPRSRQWHS